MCSEFVPPQHGGERLHRGAHDVVVGLLRGQGDTGRLGVEPQPLRPFTPRAVDVPQAACPDTACGAELGDLLEEVDVRVEEEGQSGRETVDVQTPGQAQFHVAEAVGQGVGELLGGRGPRLPDVVSGHRQRFVRRNVLRAVLHQVADQPQLWPGRVQPFLLRDVLLEDVGLQRAVEGSDVHALTLGRHQVHAEDGDRGTADGHGGGGLTERDPVEEQVHVRHGVDGHPTVTDLPQGVR